MPSEIDSAKDNRLILVLCQNAAKICRMLSEVLTYCSYSTGDGTAVKNADFILSDDPELSCDGMIRETVLFDETVSVEKELLLFQNKITSYECSVNLKEEGLSVVTYSPDHYSADVRCRNLSGNGSSNVFDVIANGILSRVQADKEKYSVEDVLVCTAVLTASGLPLASVLGFFIKNSR